MWPSKFQCYGASGENDWADIYRWLYYDGENDQLLLFKDTRACIDHVLEGPDVVDHVVSQVGVCAILQAEEEPVAAGVAGGHPTLGGHLPLALLRRRA